MKFRIYFAVVILLVITACNGTIEIGLEHSIASTTSPAVPPATIPVPIDSLVPPATTDLQPSPTVQAPTKTRGSANPPASQMVQIYLIAVDDSGQSGIPVGCGDSAVPVQVEIPPTQGVLKAALTALLSVKGQTYGQSGLYNALYQSDLQVESVSIEGGKASVYLTGSLKMGGECDTPRIQAQLERTVLQFTNVTAAAIFINGKPLEVP
jgi:hypothetical protein